MKRWYAIGPVDTVDDPVEGSYQCAPDGCIGWIDTRPVTGEVASGFFAFDVEPTHLKETHTIIGDGTRLEEYYPSLAERSAWASAYAVPVNSASDTLLQMLVSLLTEQAAPDGYERCRPLTVNHRGEYEIHLGGHSRIYRQRFQGEKDRLWPNLQRLWKAELAKTHAAEAKRGVDPDVQAGKMLCELARLHRCPVAELTPKELKGLKPRKPTTRYEDHFDYPDGEIGALENWTMIYGHSPTGLVVEGRVNLLSQSAGKRYFYNPVLSSSNHQATITSFEPLMSDYSFTATVRMDAAHIRTFYNTIVRSNQVIIRKTINATYTELSSISLLTPVPCTNTLKVDGSTITNLIDGSEVSSVTDTAIPSNVNAGFGGWTMGETVVLDNFVTADLLVASVPPQLLNMRAV